MRSDFAAARRHLTQAQHCLIGDDNVTDKMLTALSMLIEATLTAERTQNPAGKVIEFPQDGSGRLGPRWTFGNRDGSA
jgi:hypothetical protein